MDIEEIRVDSRDKERAGRLLETCGLRCDANETAHFARQLEYVKAKTYDVKFGKLKSLDFIPLDNSAPEGAETVTYEQWDEVGAAKIIANMADDLPQVDVHARDFTSKVVSTGAAYQWSIQDIRRALMAGTDFNMRKARTAKKSIDRRIDEIGAFGATENNTTGLLNDPNVPLFVLPNAGAWDTLSATQIIENMNAMPQAVVDQTLEAEEADTLLLPGPEYGLVAATPMSADNSKTILATFLENSPYITAVEQWSKMNTAGAASIRRAMAYDRSEDAVTYNIPLLFESLPPQARNLSFVVNTHARIGVVEYHYPLSAVYSDFAI